MLQNVASNFSSPASFSETTNAWDKQILQQRMFLEKVLHLDFCILTVLKVQLEVLCK